MENGELRVCGGQHGWYQAKVSVPPVAPHTEVNSRLGRGQQAGRIADLSVPPPQPVGSNYPMVNGELGVVDAGGGAGCGEPGKMALITGLGTIPTMNFVHKASNMYQI